MTAIEAGRGAVGMCPWTRQRVVARVGPIRQEWEYEGGQPALSDGYELDTDWHLRWKSLMRTPCVETIVEGEVLADIVVNGEVVVELQKTPMTLATVQDRLSFYKGALDARVVYLVDISDFWRTRLSLGEMVKRNTYEVQWTPRRPWLWHLVESVGTHVFFDFNHGSDKLLKVWAHNGEMFASFWTRKRFIAEYLVDGLQIGLTTASAADAACLDEVSDPSVRG